MSDDINTKLLNRLHELSDEFDSLQEQMADPSVATNADKSIKLAMQAGRIRRLVEPYHEFKKIDQQLTDARTMAGDSSQDSEMRDMAREEAAELETKREKRMEQLKELIVMGEDAAINALVIEIRAGTGGDEAALFVRDLYEMYLRFCEHKGYKIEVLDQSASEMGGMKEVTISVKGERCWQNLGYEGGGHRVQRVPKTESQGRVHTSAATVAVLPEPEEIDIDIDWDKDCEEFVSRAGGPGGQNVNKVSSAIRLVHNETGITVSMRDEKSQHKNRAKARRLMLMRVLDHFRQKESSARDSARKTMIGSGDRSQRIRTYNFPQNRCTDHRVNQDANLDSVMQGQIDDLIEALQTRDKHERLQAL
jgi:peptide chain release factor 1